ncbi:MAG: T9SS type A sorting domain-containing protein [Chitinophagaceae bacterium]
MEQATAMREWCLPMATLHLKLIIPWLIISAVFNQELFTYRLRSVDVDGKNQYSDVRIIRISKQSENNITILTYPNPVSNEIRITIPANWQNKKVVYEVFSLTGQMAKKIQSTNSSQTETLNVSNLNSGMYIVKVTCEGQTAQQKIVKQ